MGDVSKLPKWAHNEMTRLRRRVQELEAERDQILAGGGGNHSQGFQFESGLHQTTVPVPASIGSRRLVWRGTTGGILLTQEVSKPAGTTWMRLNGLNGDGLQVRPGVANVVLVRCIEHGEG